MNGWMKFHKVLHNAEISIIWTRLFGSLISYLLNFHCSVTSWSTNEKENGGDYTPSPQYYFYFKVIKPEKNLAQTDS